jgi:tRNA-dihydrouridine synthase A
VDALLFGDNETVDGFQAVEAYRPYLQARLDEGVPLHAMTRHMLGLFAGSHGARAWRRILTVNGVRSGADLSVLDEALRAVRGRPAQETASDGVEGLDRALV